jgi:hypothetical protein
MSKELTNQDRCLVDQYGSLFAAGPWNYEMSAAPKGVPLLLLWGNGKWATQGSRWAGGDFYAEAGDGGFMDPEAWATINLPEGTE